MNLYLETLGCQMNKLDSELVLSQLLRRGYTTVSSADQADLVVVNTCSVRRGAETKALAHLRQFRVLKRNRNVTIAVIGCMAQRLGDGMLQDDPYIDVVCGPGQLDHLSELIDQARDNGESVVAVADDRRASRRSHSSAADTHAMPVPGDSIEQLDLSRSAVGRSNPYQAFVRIQRGCDKFCTYCIVPYVRGGEQSRPPQNIVDECRHLVDQGVAEITLLGQTVSSYHAEHHGRTVRLADLLEMIHEQTIVQRLRFVTSHPADFVHDDSILQAMADLPRVCEYLHVPAQAGSDRILKAMNRRYTAAQYLDIIDRARDIVGPIGLAGDFIVGFPGETDEDFQQTVELCRQVRYKNCFVFKYSPRPDTIADKRLADDIPDHVKGHRTRVLLDMQAELAMEHNRSLIGSDLEVFVECVSKSGRKQRIAAEVEDEATESPPDNNHSSAARSSSDWSSDTTKVMQLCGRTRQDQIVVFDGPTSLIGTQCTVGIVDASALTLFGSRVV